MQKELNRIMSDSTFADLGVTTDVVRALESRGIERPFPIQALVMADALAGRDVLAKSRTGSGKTLGFALPIVERVKPSGRPSALVLVPTRELAVQVADEFRDIAKAKGLQVALAYGGTRVVEQGKRAAKCPSGDHGGAGLPGVAARGDARDPPRPGVLVHCAGRASDRRLPADQAGGGGPLRRPVRLLTPVGRVWFDRGGRRPQPA